MRTRATLPRILFVAAALTACELPSRPPIDPGESTAARLAVSPRVVTLQQNEATNLMVVGFTSAGDTATVAVVWSATSGAITETSSNSGRHYGRYKAGSDTGQTKVVVRGNPGGAADTAVVTVTPASVASVAVSPTAGSVTVGQTAQLTATPRDASGNPLSGRVVTWATSNASVASVNGNGLVTGGAVGSATITATSEASSGTATITVANVPVASVTVSPATASVTVGQTAQLAATPTDASGNPLSGRVVTWATSNASIASVSGNGLVTGGAVGSATITATSEGRSGTATITVTNVPVASVTVSPATANLTAGQTVQLAATPRDVNGNPLTGRVVTWASNAPSVATVSASGVVTASAAGSTTITATSEGRSGTAAVTVSVAPVASVSVSPATASVTVGQAVQLTATPRDASGNPLSGRVVTWASNAPGVATVSGSGLVTGVTAGSATITATSEGRSGTAAVTVTATVTNPGTVTNLAFASVTANSVTLSFTEVTDGAGQPASYEIRWAAGALEWGSATPVGQGTCRVPVAGAAIGALRSCTVLGLAASTGYQFQLAAFRGTLNVDAVFGALSNVASGTTAASTAPVATVTVTPATANLGIGQTLQLAATLRDAAGNTLIGRAVTWSSAFPLLASVNGSGVVSGLLAGVVPITATSEGKGASSSITVSAQPPPPTGLFPNEPSGFTVIEEASWEGGLLGAWFRKFTSADRPITIVPITDSPLGEGLALQLGYNAGHSGGGGTELEYDIPAALQPREMFVGYYVQVNSTWQGHGSGINKMVYLDDGGASFSAMWYEMFGSGADPLGLYVVNQSGSGPAGMHENVTPVNFVRGQWHKVEIYQKQGSPGIIRVWVNGVLAINRSDVYTRDAAIGMVTISGIWGGVGDSKDHFDYMRFDRIRISGR